MRLQNLIRGVDRTRLLYLEDAYMRTTRAKVLRGEVEKKRSVYLLLDKTIFHPKSGGQPTDKGVIDSPTLRIDIKKAMILKGVIVHWGKIVEGQPDETEVQATIKWLPRYLYMRRHTAGHLLDHCLKVISDQPVETVDSWLGEPCYVSYKGEPPSRDTMTEVVNLGNTLIEKGATVRVETVSHDKLIRMAPDAPNIYRVPHLEAYRLVTIDGCDPIPCAGTHIININEIGRIVLNDVEKMKSQFKVYYNVQ